MNDTEHHPIGVEIFSGCGAMGVGAMFAGVDLRASYDIDPFACDANRVNLAGVQPTEHAVFSRDLRETHPKHPLRVVDDVEVLLGGFPCQPFSPSRGDRGPDERANLAFITVDWMAALSPDLAIFENVTGLVDDHAQLHYRLTDQMRDLGYEVKTIRVNAADYCVPQERERVFICAVREDHEPPESFYPKHFHHGGADGQQSLIGGGLEERRPCSAVLEDLPEPLPPQRPVDDPVHSTYPGSDHRVRPNSCGAWVNRDGNGGYVLGGGGGCRGEVMMPPNHVAPNHRQETRENYSGWELGCSKNVTTRRLHPDRPAPTMTVSQGTPPLHYIGKAPGNDEPVENVRRLTVREVARLQTFPDWFCFPGTRRQQFQQAGNAVPPHLADHVIGHFVDAVFTLPTPVPTTN